MKIYFTFIILFLSFYSSNAQSNCQLNKLIAGNQNTLTAPENKRSDTADILKYTVTLNITDFATSNIFGNTVVRFAPKINGLNYICLDLLKMTIDSVSYNNSNLTYIYNDTLLKVNLPGPFNTTDTLDITIAYHGIPKQDGSWGGWYNSSGYQFNLGVGFDSDPHCFGRVFHPCFDNFTEHAKYEFNIATNNGKLAYCNGVLTKDTTVNGLRIRSWKLEEEIPSYLASIAVAAYAEVNYTFNTQSGSLPGIVAALPSDTNNVRASFIHLADAMAAFENWYGPYVWPRVGFCVVPFSSGAMEHATNISVGKAFVNGTLNYEADIMAHELSHHWWGNHVTCETANEMWINEGHASYSQFIFTEEVYGHTAYLNAVKANHDLQVHYVELKEGLYAVNNVPNNITYGDHVYLKGADMVHCMRGYLGDSLFKIGLKTVQQQRAFKNMNTVEYGQLLTVATGVDMNQFMADWIMNPGYPHFSIDSTKSVAATGGNYNVTVYIKQKLHDAPNYYTNVPLEITFKKADWSSIVKKMYVSGLTTSATFTLPFNPVYSGINLESKISDAVSSKYVTIKNAGPINMTPANLSINVSSAGIDSSWLRVEHNYVSPDPVKNNTNNYHLNTQHYWKIDGILASGFVSKATFNWDGGKALGNSASYLDTCLFSTSADSIILLYRKNTKGDWKEVDKYTKLQTAGPNGKRGYFKIDTLRLGEYTTANGIGHNYIGISEKTGIGIGFNVFPNPAKGIATIEIKDFDPTAKYFLKLFDITGREIVSDKIMTATASLSLQSIAAGPYIMEITKGKEVLGSKKLVVE